MSHYDSYLSWYFSHEFLGLLAIYYSLVTILTGVSMTPVDSVMTQYEDPFWVIYTTHY